MPTSTGKIYLGDTLVSGGGGGEPVLEWSQAYYDEVYASGPASWSRPEWRTLPTVGSSEQKFVGLHAVFPEDGNFCALVCSGAYTVDWGDGVVENFATGVQANHIYQYTDADLAGTDAPVAIASSIVTRTAHGFTNGKQVTFWNIAGVTGIANGQIYYVVNATTNTFQVSATLGGSALTLTGTGTASLSRYKQAIVTVTPQSGQNLTALTLNVKHSQAGTQLYTAGWLDITVGSPQFSATGLVIAQDNVTVTVRKRYLERVRVVNLGATNTLSYRFSLPALQVIELPSTAGVTNFENMFYGSISLETVPLFNTSNATSLSSMFWLCNSLITVPFFNTPNVTNTASMFYQCKRLETIPAFDLSKVTSISGMFQTCRSLISTPAFNTPLLVGNLLQTFLDCTALKSVGLFNTSGVTNMSLMFVNCYALDEVPLFDTSSCTNMSSMFESCFSLKTISLFNTANVTTMSSMFLQCYALETVPLLNTANVTSMNSMFRRCYALAEVPLLNTIKVTTMASMFDECTSLETVPLFNTGAVTTMAGMFQFCASFKSVPLFDTANVTNMSIMFNGCAALQAVPLFNMVKVTNTSNMFSNCDMLQTVPLFNTAAVTNLASMFQGCTSLQNIPAINVTAATSFTGFVTTCNSLARIEAGNFRFSFTVASAKLSSAALNEIYTNLPTVTGQTITVTGNYGTTGDTPSIATAKGWTVTG